MACCAPAASAPLTNPSRLAPGDCMSRRELAEAVNAWLREATCQRYELDAHPIARYERGAVRWPSAAYRSGLRHVLGATTDAPLASGPRGRTLRQHSLWPEPPIRDHRSRAVGGLRGRGVAGAARVSRLATFPR